MRLEAVTECEHCATSGNVDCGSGSRRVASTSDLIEALKGLGAIEAESRHLLMEVIMSWKPGRYLVFPLEGEK